VGIPRNLPAETPRGSLGTGVRPAALGSAGHRAASHWRFYPRTAAEAMALDVPHDNGGQHVTRATVERPLARLSGRRPTARLAVRLDLGTASRCHEASRSRSRNCHEWTRDKRPN